MVFIVVLFLFILRNYADFLDDRLLLTAEYILSLLEGPIVNDHVSDNFIVNLVLLFGVFFYSYITSL